MYKKRQRCICQYKHDMNDPSMKVLEKSSRREKEKDDDDDENDRNNDRPTQTSSGPKHDGGHFLIVPRYLRFAFLRFFSRTLADPRPRLSAKLNSSSVVPSVPSEGLGLSSSGGGTKTASSGDEDDDDSQTFVDCLDDARHCTGDGGAKAWVCGTETVAKTTAEIRLVLSLTMLVISVCYQRQRLG